MPVQTGTVAVVPFVNASGAPADEWVGVRTSEMGRDYRLGYSLGALGGEGTTFELGVDAQRRERPLQAGTDHAALARATLRW